MLREVILNRIESRSIGLIEELTIDLSTIFFAFCHCERSEAIQWRTLGYYFLGYYFLE